MEREQLEDLLQSMVRANATTMHIMAGSRPCMRIKDRLVRGQQEPLLPGALEDLAADFLVEAHRHQLWRGREVELLFQSKSGERFRTTVMRQADGLSMVFRRIPQSVPSFDQLGLPDVLNGFVGFRSGLVLVSGFVRSGKSTTMAAMVDRLNKETASNVVTIEEPIEYIFEPAASLVHQREVGFHVHSFAEGVRQAVKLSADVVMLGEVQDHETLLEALSAVENGCLVMATMDASSVTGALETLVSRCPPENVDRTLRRLAAALRVLMSQALLSRAHGKGRVPCLEILINNQAVAEAIQTNRFNRLPEIMKRSRGLGMQTIDMGLKALLGKNMITTEEAVYHATDRDYMYARGV